MHNPYFAIDYVSRLCSARLGFNWNSQWEAGSWWNNHQFSANGIHHDNFILALMSCSAIKPVLMWFWCQSRYFSKRPGYKSLVTWVSSASFTIYFCHLIFIELFQSGILGFKLYAMTLTPLVGLPLTTLSVVALSSFLTAVIRPIPVLKKITPWVFWCIYIWYI